MLIYKEKLDCLRIVDDNKAEWIIVLSRNPDKITAIPQNTDEGPYKLTRKGAYQMFGESINIFLPDV